MGKYSGRTDRNRVKESKYFLLNIIIHGSGALGWTIAGYLTKDRALLTNFCLQLPIFAFGIGRYLLAI